MPDLDLRTLPKAHLHLHLEAAIRPATLAELGQRHGVRIPDTVGRNRSWAELVELYAAIVAVLRTEADLARLVDEVVADNAAEGVVWLEPTLFAPPYRAIFGDDHATVHAVSGMLQDACRRHGTAGGLVLIADRMLDPAEAVVQARVAADFAGVVVAFGLANYEVGYPGRLFREAFEVARLAGLQLVPHAGEMTGPEEVREALDVLGANRIAHGISAVEDASLVARLAREQICLDVCPSSNVDLGFAPSWESHPLKFLLEAGVPCSLNADDPAMIGVGILEEYKRCHVRLGLDIDKLARIARASVQFSAASDDHKRAVVQGIEQWAAA